MKMSLKHAYLLPESVTAVHPIAQVFDATLISKIPTVAMDAVDIFQCHCKTNILHFVYTLRARVQVLQTFAQVRKAGLLIMTLLMVSSGNAADFKQGLAAYDAKDYQKTLQEWLPLAEQGDEYAQTGLGLLYQFGNGVSMNYQEAVKWYSLAAGQGSIVSQDMLISLQNKMIDWDVKEKAASVILVNLETSMKTHISARVRYSQGGSKQLYFIIEYDKLQCDITKDSENPATQTWSFGHQTVKMAKVCAQYSDTKNLYFYLLPHNNIDAKSIVSTFLNAVNKVVIKTDTLTFKMPAQGFSKVWNSMSATAQ